MSFAFSSNTSASVDIRDLDNFGYDESVPNDVKVESRAFSPAKRFKELFREVENKVSIFVFVAGRYERWGVKGHWFSVG